MRAHIEEISTKGTPCYSVPLKILRTIIVEVHMDIHSFLALEIIVQLKCLTYQNCSLYWPSLLHTLSFTNSVSVTAITSLKTTFACECFRKLQI